MIRRKLDPRTRVLVATKAWRLPEAARAMKPLVGKDTSVVPLLNGVEALDVMAEIPGLQPVLGGLCKISAFKTAPRLIRHVGVKPDLPQERMAMARRLGRQKGQPSASRLEYPAKTQKSASMAQVARGALSIVSSSPTCPCSNRQTSYAAPFCQTCPRWS